MSFDDGRQGGGSYGGPADVGSRQRPGAPPGGRGPGGWQTARENRGIIPQVTVRPPWIEKPQEATDFNTAGTLLSRTNANTPQLFDGTGGTRAASFQIPEKNVGTIRAITILANALLVTSDIVWTLLFDNRPVSGWNDLTISPRAAGSLEFSWTPDETFVPVPENTLIEWRVLVIDGGTYQVSVTMHGWFYPTSVASRYRLAA